MLKRIEEIAKRFLKETEGKDIEITSHNDTDGITSAAIMIKTLQRLDKKFSVKIVKQLDRETVKKLPKDKVNIFLDLGSASLTQLQKLDSVFVIDHHEVNNSVPKKINLINPRAFGEEETSGSGLTYLFAKSIDKENHDLANLAVIGMVGDLLDRNISKLNNVILKDAQLVIKKSLLLYPSTRPINKVLEFSNLFIPGVTGSARGAVNLLKEVGIEKVNGAYKSLIELDEEETSRLVTSILLRGLGKNKEEDIIGNVYLIKFFNKLEDAREISAMVNACSRLGYSDIALSLCMENKNSRKKAEAIYTDYKQELISALNFVSTTTNKIEGKDYVIINAKNKIKDTIIGTTIAILSKSSLYEEGTVLVGMAYSGKNVKVSARVAGRNGKNVYEIIDAVSKTVDGESGGHPFAAGSLIAKEKEREFIECLKKRLEIEVVKI